MLQSVAYIAQVVGVVGTLTAAFIAVRSYINANRRTEESKKKEQETRDRELETRRLQLLTSYSERLFNYEESQQFVELMNMQWSDWDDFEKKYGSDFNLHNGAIRLKVFFTWDLLGSMLREKAVDAETLYKLSFHMVIFLWMKFKGYIDYEREHYFGKDFLVDFEYLAQEMLRIKLRNDPTYKVPPNFISYIKRN
jgi:hypothetical protein